MLTVMLFSGGGVGNVLWSGFVFTVIAGYVVWVGFKFNGSWLIVVPVLGVGFESVVLGLGSTVLLNLH